MTGNRIAEEAVAAELLEDCPYCHVPGGREVADSPRVVACERCGLYRLVPRMDREGQIDYLDRLAPTFGGFHASHPADGLPGCRYELELIARTWPGLLRGGRVLEVGAGDGTFTHALTQAGAKATGLEPIQVLVDQARRCGLDLRSGRFEEDGIAHELLGERFDLICFRESLYYMPDLKAAFRLIHKLLARDGRLYIKSHQANSYYYWRNTDYTSRYKAWVSGMPTPGAMQYVLLQEGFRVVHSGFFPANVFRDLGYEAFKRSLAGRALNAAAWRVLNMLGYGDRLVVLAAANAN